MKIEVTLGIDVGGTNTAFGFVDVNGKCVAESSIQTKAQNSAADLFSRLHPEIEKLYQTISDKYLLKGIGVGAPNANYYRGTVENPPNLKWGVVNVVEILKQYYDVPVAITNDANASAIGEMLFGAAKGMKDVIVITLGTGLGSGVVVDGKLVYGSDGFAGEIGHTVYDPNGRQCGCGKKGCLETYASATGIKRTVMELLATSNEDSALRNVNYNDLESKMIYTSALAGDKLAKEAFEITGKILGLKLADAVAVTSPEAIILFGGLALAGDMIINPTKKSLEENLFHVFRNKVKILPSGLPEGNSAVLGSAALIWNEIIKLETVTI
ncbi:MAG: ROK family protein [Ignavibacteriales bacterium]|nr:ROK family protein [Ignavibacteriales bacterium]